ncbi:hypothetical protein ACSFA2_16775 [Variovorax sp. LT2P21]|uniref:hypothetical protein n=1 Tax=Variovorax sp. LT2P21 TaxID=3443731 RepID=UPI003F44E777
MYALRQAGMKLPREVVPKLSVVGWLFMGQDSRKFYTQTTARLFRTPEILIDVIEPLVHAHVKKIDRGGILIFGQEEQQAYQAPNVTQVWWCKPREMNDALLPMSPATMRP